MSNFPYRKHLSGCYPIVPLALAHKQKQVEVYALIDSGATTSIFRPEVAEELDLEIEKGEEIYLTGVGGRIKGYLHNLKIKVAGKEFISPIIFSYEYTVSLNLLGREGFFKNFLVVFDEKSGKVELR